MTGIRSKPVTNGGLEEMYGIFFIACRSCIVHISSIKVKHSERFNKKGSHNESCVESRLKSNKAIQGVYGGSHSSFALVVSQKLILHFSAIADLTDFDIYHIGRWMIEV